MKILSVKERINSRLDIHIRHHKRGIRQEVEGSHMYDYHKHKLDQALDAHDIIEDAFQEYYEDRGFWQGSLKVAAVLGFLYIVGYLLSKGFAG